MQCNESGVWEFVITVLIGLIVIALAAVNGTYCSRVGGTGPENCRYCHTGGR